MAILGNGEFVHVRRGGVTKLPTEFSWRGKHYLIRAIEGYRVDFRQSSEQRSERRIYRIRTSLGLRCLLSEDPRHGTWQMEGVVPDSGGKHEGRNVVA
jgi:hypothetical protein